MYFHSRLFICLRSRTHCIPGSGIVPHFQRLQQGPHLEHSPAFPFGYRWSQKEERLGFGSDWRKEYWQKAGLLPAFPPHRENSFLLSLILRVSKKSRKNVHLRRHVQTNQYPMYDCPATSRNDHLALPYLFFCLLTI